MGGIITYTATSFNEPNPLKKETYSYFKKIFAYDRYAETVENEGFYSKFRRHINMIIIGAVGVLISLAINAIFRDKAETLCEWVSLLSGLLLFVGLIYLILEGLSYSDYLRKSDAYFLRMKYAIIKSEDFDNFNKIFYSIFSADYDLDFKKWRKDYYKQAKKSSTTSK